MRWVEIAAESLSVYIIQEILQVAINFVIDWSSNWALNSYTWSMDLIFEIIFCSPLQRVCVGRFEVNFTALCKIFYKRWHLLAVELYCNSASIHSVTPRKSWARSDFSCHKTPASPFVSPAQLWRRVIYRPLSLPSRQRWRWSEVNPLVVLASVLNGSEGWRKIQK